VTSLPALAADCTFGVFFSRLVWQIAERFDTTEDVAGAAMQRWFRGR
jgi:hypothetical protein